jgi:hypothetical protein
MQRANVDPTQQDAGQRSPRVWVEVTRQTRAETGTERPDVDPAPRQVTGHPLAPGDAARRRYLVRRAA